MQRMHEKNKQNHKQKNLEVFESLDSEFAFYVYSRLLEFDAKQYQDKTICHREDVRLFISDENEQIYGGLLGRIYWKVLFIDTFWIAEQFRRCGYGREFLQRAEDLAQTRGYNRILVQTASLNAPDF